MAGVEETFAADIAIQATLIHQEKRNVGRVVL